MGFYVNMGRHWAVLNEAAAVGAEASHFFSVLAVVYPLGFGLP